VGFNDLDILIRYRSELHNFPRDFLIPVLEKSVVYKRGVGYFSTSSLIAISVGLFEMAKKGGKILLVCSPNLDSEDIEAINLGYKTREEIIEKSLLRELNDPVDYFETERLNLIATLIANGTMDIKIAFLEDDNGISLYHEKIAVFIDEEGNRISYAGSLNESSNGFYGNFESIYTFCSWKDESQKEAVDVAEADFDNLWNDSTQKLHVIEFPRIVAEKLMKYKKETLDDSVDEQQFGYRHFLKSQMKFKIPEDVTMRNYQKKAIDNWFAQGCRGIFNMSTGSGKTFTALYGMVKLAIEKSENLGVFIVCPYIHLVSQWEEDVINWGPDPIICHSKSPDKRWDDSLLKAYKRFKKDGTPFICITTLDTFADEKIQKFITRFSDEQNVLLIVDEAHNFGSERMINIMPYNIQYRIGLSATIKRHMDKTGTKKLYDYFGEECINYGLEDAIKDGNLVHYEYHPIPVFLTYDEFEKYGELTRKLKRYIVIKDGKMKISDAGKPVIYERTRLLAGAINKVELLMQLIEPFRNENNILVYCGATSVEDDETGEEKRQIDLITDKLRKEMGMSVKRFTSEEDLKERQNIKTYFSQGMYQVITAIRCLDEGVNIPGIKIAFILSSSRNPKEFIQRRGRLLRKSKGKDKAIIYDFVTLPRELENVVYGDFDEDKSVVLGELARMEEFGRLSDNPEVTDNLMNKIMDAYETYVDIEEEMKKLEDYYGE
jgi:superfamily II DNA or RNA helicase